MKKLASIAVMSVMVLSLVVFTCVSAFAASDAMVIKFGHSQVETHPYHLAAEQFKAYIEKNAPMPVNVELYPNCVLGSEREMTEALQLGSLEVALAPGSILSFMPSLGALSMPYLFESREHVYRVLDGPVGVELAAGFPSIGLRVLSYWENGFRQITNSKRPISVPADLQGIKIRTPENPIYVDSFSSWGANVTSMAWGEVFTALQQGAIDAQENSFAIVSTNKLWEVQDYLSISNHVYEPAPLLISLNFYESLSPEMQEVVSKAADVARDFEREYLKDRDQQYIAEIEANGMKINQIDLNAFKEASKPIWDKYSAEYGDMIKKLQGTN